MLESILQGKTKAKRFLRASLLTSLTALSLSCGKDKPTQSGSGSGTGAGSTGSTTSSTAHYQQTAKTNASGIAQVSVRNFDLSTKITNESNQPLQGIDVALIDQGSCYRLISVDPQEKYTSASIFIPLNRLTKPIAESTSEGPDLNLIMYQFFEGQPKVFEKKVADVKPGDKRSKDSRKLATTTLINLYDFYLANDALVKNAGVYEFILETSGEYLKIPELQFASTLNKERSKFLRNILIIENKAMEIFGGYLGGSQYDPYGHYWDIFETPTPLGIVLSHVESKERLCTLKVFVYTGNGNEKMGVLTSLRVKGVNNSFQQESRALNFTNLSEGQYLISITEPGFIASTSATVRYFNPPTYASTKVDLQAKLDPNSSTNLRTTTIQATYANGQAAVWFDFESGSAPKASGEIPPTALHDTYSEPQDPEISSADGKNRLALVGNVPLSQIRNASIYNLVSGYYNGKDSNGKNVTWGPGSSFVCKTNEANWAKFRVLELDSINHKMRFEYQVTGNSNGIFPN